MADTSSGGGGASIAQIERIGTLKGPNGMEPLQLSRFEGTEKVNDLFEFKVTAVASSPIDDFSDMMGKNFTTSITTRTDETRHFDGLLVAAQAIGQVDGEFGYELTLRPWFWLAQNRVTSRTFENKTPKEVIEEVLGAYGSASAGKVEVSLNRSYPTIGYLVQYQESDLDFVRRVCERYSINFHFAHEDGGHKLVFSDGDFKALALGGGSRRVVPVGGGVTGENEETFSTFNTGQSFTPKSVIFKDYDFTNPTGKQEQKFGDTSTNVALNPEVFLFPGRVNPDGFTGTAQRAMDAIAGGGATTSATGDCLSVGAGDMVTMQDADGGQIDDFVCMSATHAFYGPAYSTQSSLGVEKEYEGHYSFAKATGSISPPKVTPEPKIYGPQTAMVVGSGEIDVDEHGRIMVNYHWNRGAQNQMRVRVMQPWGGKGWGTQFIPRVGMEVVVEFLGGDPDMPLVTGSVFNGDNGYPNGMPGDKNISGIKTESTTGGGGNNWLLFNDTAGEELIDIQAQFDMKTKVLHDMETTVDFNRTTEVMHNEKKTIHKTLYKNVKKAAEYFYDDILDQTVKEKAAYLFNNTLKFDVIKGAVYTFSNTFSQTVKEAAELAFDDVLTQTVKGKATLTYKSPLTETVKGTMDRSSTGDMELKSDSKITLKVGSTKMEMTGTDITFTTTNFKVKATSIDLGATGDFKAKGSMSELKGSATTTIKGGLVKIN